MKHLVWLAISLFFFGYFFCKALISLAFDDDAQLLFNWLCILVWGGNAVLAYTKIGDTHAKN